MIDPGCIGPVNIFLFEEIKYRGWCCGWVERSAMGEENTFSGDIELNQAVVQLQGRAGVFIIIDNRNHRRHKHQPEQTDPTPFDYNLDIIAFESQLFQPSCNRRIHTIGYYS